MATETAPPLIVHLLYRFDTGGLENGVVNLINRLPPGRYRHMVIALTEVTDFRLRVQQPGVEFLALHKPPGHGWGLYPRLYRLLRRLRPAVVHTRNLAALEFQLAAWAARVPLRVHGEHGRDVSDLDGSRRRYQWLRRAYSPFVHRYVALSRDLGDYLERKVGIAPRRIRQIYNGVDTAAFHPAAGIREAMAGCPFGAPEQFIIGSVGRMQAVKDPLNLARAFALALQIAPALRSRLRLAMVGDGPLRADVQAELREQGLTELAWLPGDRSDVAQLMRGFDCFVLPSLAEGVSNTILEAMASGLPVLATRVGGNAELVDEGQTGLLLPPAEPRALAEALVRLATDAALACRMGQGGRQRAERRFSMQAMLEGYQAVYDNRPQAGTGQAAVIGTRS